MKFKIKIHLYVLKECFIEILCEENICESLSKSNEMIVNMRKGSLTKIPK